MCDSSVQVSPLIAGSEVCPMTGHHTEAAGEGGRPLVRRVSTNSRLKLYHEHRGVHAHNYCPLDGGEEVNTYDE